MNTTKVIVITPDELRKIVVEAVKEATQGLPNNEKQKPHQNPIETPSKPHQNPIETPDIKLGIIRIADSIEGGLQCPYSIIRFANQVNAKSLCELLAYVETERNGKPLFDYIKAHRGMGTKRAHEAALVISALETAKTMAKDSKMVEAWSSYLSIDNDSAKVAVFNMWFYGNLNDPLHTLYKFIPDYD